MADGGAPGQLEQALDRELAESKPTVQRESGDHVSGSAEHTRGKPGRSLSVRQLRLDFLRSLRAGMTVSEDIYDESGALLLAAGSKITPRFVQLLQERHINRIQRGDGGEFISVRQLHQDFIRSLEVGMSTPVDVYDESGVLLLAAGSRITRRFIQLLHERGITEVRLGSAPDLPPGMPVDDSAGVITEDGLSTPRSRGLDRRLAGELDRPVVFHSIKRWRRPRLSTDDLKGEANQGLERHLATSTAVADVCAALNAGRRISAAGLRHSVAHFVNMSAADFDLLPLIVAMQQSKDEYLYDHCVNVALLSLAIASQLGLDRESFIVIGLGGMLHDIGMLRVPQSIRLAPGALTEREWHEIRRHPLHTLDMLADLPRIPQAVKFIAYQAHERIDGGGYPRHRSDRELHAFAKIVSIADVYAAMTRARPYRPPISPYVAVKTILTDGHTNKFDRVLVRALLDTIALFPIGSRARLSDGSAVSILRANPDLHTRPVVEVLGVDGRPSGRIIDLSREDDLRVVGVT